MDRIDAMNAFVAVADLQGFAPAARRLGLSASAVTRLVAALEQPRGKLVVTAPVGFGRLHVTPLMSAFLQRYGDVAGELRLNDRMVNLVEEGIDLAVRVGHLADSSLMARQVGDMPRVVVASPAYLKRRGVPKAPEDIASHDTIQFGAVAAPPEWR
jgi:DNA-binding transcriptional LysR family regulator